MPILLIFIRNKPRLPLPVMCHVPLLNHSLFCPSYVSCVYYSRSVDWITYSCYDLYVFCFMCCWHQAELLKSNSLCSAACVSPLAAGSGCRDNPGPFMLGFGTCKKLLADNEVQSLICEWGPSPCSQPTEQAQSTRVCSHKCIGSV